MAGCHCAPLTFALCCSLKSLETLVQMGERIAVKPGSLFERTTSQKRQLALQTENSTVGVDLFQPVDASDTARLGNAHASTGSVCEEDLSSSAVAALSLEPQTLEGSGSEPQTSVHQSSASPQSTQYAAESQISMFQESPPYGAVSQSSGQLESGQIIDLYLVNDISAVIAVIMNTRQSQAMHTLHGQSLPMSSCRHGFNVGIAVCCIPINVCVSTHLHV